MLCEFKQSPDAAVRAYGWLLDSGQFSDVTLIVSERRFALHKCVLAAHSTYFRAMLGCGMQESTMKEIRLLDLSSETFHHIVQFMYTGVTQVPEELITQVLHESKYIGFSDLEHAVAEFALSKLDHINVLPLLELYPPGFCDPDLRADEPGLTRDTDDVRTASMFRRKCLEYIWAEGTFLFRFFLKSCTAGDAHMIDAVGNLSPESLLEIIENDQLQSEELEIFSFIVVWARLREARLSAEDNPQQPSELPSNKTTSTQHPTTTTAAAATTTTLSATAATSPVPRVSNSFVGTSTNSPLQQGVSNTLTALSSLPLPLLDALPATTAVAVTTPPSVHRNSPSPHPSNSTTSTPTTTTTTTTTARVLSVPRPAKKSVADSLPSSSSSEILSFEEISTPSALQQELVATVIPGVRFGLVNEKDLFSCVRASGLVSDTVILNAIECRSLKHETKLTKPRAWRTTFDFVIDEFSQKRGKVYSNPIRWKKEEWKMLVFPKGNASEGDLSFYLTVCGDEEQRSPDAIHFILTVVNQVDATKSKSRELSHKFTKYENDWGYVSFIKLDRVLCPSEGFCVEDKVICRVEFIDDNARGHSANANNATNNTSNANNTNNTAPNGAQAMQQGVGPQALVGRAV